MNGQPQGPIVRRAGSAAVLVELDGLDAVLELHSILRSNTPAGVRELLPAARTLFVAYDPKATAYDTLRAELADRVGRLTGEPAHTGAELAVLDIPVRYDGPDLAAVSAQTGMSVADVIARHTAPLYTVAFAGFAPGFGYLVGTDQTLHLPRRTEPRTAVPSGAVAVAGGFTGIYPRSSPGGWQLLGTTTLSMWDERRDPPALLVPGRSVRLRAVG